MDIIRNAWEVDDKDELLALHGHGSREEFIQDRQERAKEIVDWCSVTPNSRGFEIGSGDGTVALLLASQCLALDCTDISGSLLDRARATCAQLSNVSFYKTESDYINYLPAETYDFGFSLHVFIHFNAYDIFNYLVSVNRALKPGAMFYFDACTVGEQTLPVFREHAGMYSKAPETIRGLLNFNHPSMLARVISEAGLETCDKSTLSDDGWMKVLVRRKLEKRQRFSFLRR